MVCHSERSNVVAKSKNLVLILFTVCAMSLSLTACGDDDSSFAPRSDDDSSIESSSSSVILSGDSHEGSSPSSSSSTDKKSSSSSAKSSSSDTSKLSSSVNSSSSSATSSSSVTLATPCKTESEDNCEYGELVDERDGQVYKTVKIGDQWWMAENLNFETDNSFCYNDSASYCEKYGRLYTWAAAMDSVGTWSTNGKGCGYDKTCLSTSPVRGVCPEGWHLPTSSEWSVLSLNAAELKSTSGWNGDGNGSDDFGLSVHPAGGMNPGGISYDEGNSAFFWTCSAYSSSQAHVNSLDYDRSFVGSGTNYKNYRYSVRCLKD